MKLNLERLIDTSFVFIKRDLKQRYASSILGPVWIILYPLLLVSVVAVIFSLVFSDKVLGVPYAVFVLIGFIHWIYFSQVIAHLTRSFLNQRRLIANANFPLLSIPVSVLVSRFIDYIIGLVLLIVLLLYFYHINFLKLLLIVPLVLFQTLFQFGLGLIFASLNMVWRDVQYLVDVGMQILFYITPVIYSTKIVPIYLQKIILLNPLVLFFINYHNIFLDYEVNWLYFFISGLTSLFILLLGLKIYKKYRYIIPELS